MPAAVVTARFESNDAEQLKNLHLVQSQAPLTQEPASFRMPPGWLSGAMPPAHVALVFSETLRLAVLRLVLRQVWIF